MWRNVGLGVLLMVSTVAVAKTPKILEVYREYLKPNAARELRKIEVDSAQICIRLKFPHRYLVLESVTGPKEFWYLNAFESQEEIDEVGRLYEGNSELKTALAENLKRKDPYLEAESSNVFMKYRGDLSGHMPWQMGNGRFLIVTWSKRSAAGDGTVFEDAEGTQLVLQAARTRTEARSIALTAGKGASVLKIHPELGWPDAGWVKDDPEFWRVRQR
jgi:hypothetical protein